MSQTKRLRIFAGPNGSGKTTVFRGVKRTYRTGPFVNADDIERELRESGIVSLTQFGIQLRSGEWRDWCRQSEWMQGMLEQGKVRQIRVRGNRLLCKLENTVGYEAALVSSFVREALLARGKTFSMETVMSHPSKIEVIEKAKDLGYRPYLYFICTESPEINVARVAQRVAKGEHGVPTRKIRARYKRSLELLQDAIRVSYRAFLFDNSEEEYNLLLEYKEAKEMVLREEYLPEWALLHGVKPFFPDLLK